MVCTGWARRDRNIWIFTVQETHPSTWWIPSFQHWNICFWVIPSVAHLHTEICRTSCTNIDGKQGRTIFFFFIVVNVSSVNSLKRFYIREVVSETRLKKRKHIIRNNLWFPWWVRNDALIYWYQQATLVIMGHTGFFRDIFILLSHSLDFYHTLRGGLMGDI